MFAPFTRQFGQDPQLPWHTAWLTAVSKPVSLPGMVLSTTGTTCHVAPNGRERSYWHHFLFFPRGGLESSSESPEDEPVDGSMRLSLTPFGAASVNELDSKVGAGDVFNVSNENVRIVRVWPW